MMFALNGLWIAGILIAAGILLCLRITAAAGAAGRNTGLHTGSDDRVCERSAARR